MNWFALVYPVVTIPAGLLASWFLDTYGLRTGVCVQGTDNSEKVLLVGLYYNNIFLKLSESFNCQFMKFASK